MPPVTILLVEDEPIIALDLQRRLEDTGYRLVLADQASDALLTCSNERPALALVNFKQSGLPDGMVLARQLRDRFQVPVGFITGARPADLSGSVEFDSSYRVLYKPFTRRQLDLFIRGGLE